MAKSLLDSKFNIKRIRSFVDEQLKQYDYYNEGTVKNLPIFKTALKEAGFNIDRAFINRLVETLIMELLNKVKAYFDTNKFSKRKFGFAEGYNFISVFAVEVTKEAVAVLSDDVINDWQNCIGLDEVKHLKQFKKDATARYAFEHYIYKAFQVVIKTILKNSIDK